MKLRNTTLALLLSLICIDPSFAGFWIGEANISPLPTWLPLQIGAGGFLTGGGISSDNTLINRTDTYGSYVWNSTAKAPNGVTGTWQQINTIASLLTAGNNFGGQGLNSGIYELQVAYNNSNIMYMETIQDNPVQPPNYAVYYSSNKGQSWTLTPLNQIPSGTCPSSQNSTSTSNDPYRGRGPKIAIDPQTPSTAYVGTGQLGLWFTNNSGSTFTQISSSQVPAALAASGSNDCVGYAGMVMDMSHNLYVYSYGNGVYECTSSTSCTHLTAGGGPQYVYKGEIDYNTGYYWVVEGSAGANTGATGNIWVWNGTTWSETITGSAAQAIAIDPNKAGGNYGHVIAIDGSGNLDETFTSGVTSWSGFSTTNNNTNNGAWRSSTNDVPWYSSAGGGLQPIEAFFDRTVAKTIYLVANGQYWVSSPWAGNILPGGAGTQVVWNSMARGIEQLVAIQVLLPKTLTPVTGSWDFGVDLPTFAGQAYPTSSYLWPILSNGGLAAVWSMDFCTSNHAYLYALAAGNYGPVGSNVFSVSSTYATSWQLFNGPVPLAPGGNIACATPDNVFFAPATGQPYYSKNMTTSQTWSPVTISGIFNATTILSGTYTPANSSVTLVASPSIAGGGTGNPFNLSNITATGIGSPNAGALNTNVAGTCGSVPCGVTVVGNTITYSATAGTSNFSITGGNLTGWNNGWLSWVFGQSDQDVCADRNTTGDFYILTYPPTGGATTTMYYTTNGGTSWASDGVPSTAMSGNSSIHCTPGITGDVWIKEGSQTNCCSIGGYAGFDSGIVHVTGAHTGSPTITKLTSAPTPFIVSAFGFGAVKPGNTCCGGSGYPELLLAGWMRFPSTSTVNVGSTGNVTFNIGTNLTILPNSSVSALDFGNTQAWGNVVSYNPATGNLVMNIQTPGSGSFSTWDIGIYGVWSSDDEAASWQQLGAPTDGRYDAINTISGDPGVWGMVYVGHGGSGYEYLP